MDKHIKNFMHITKDFAALDSLRKKLIRRDLDRHLDYFLKKAEKYKGLKADVKKLLVLADKVAQENEGKK